MIGRRNKDTEGVDVPIITKAIQVWGVSIV